ncbi:MAG: hypothetical protein HYY62_03335 [Deltaproteobacteria bacterium]|nr:hypothetical protein [Deltaproteobacteria bacterium]
MKVKWIVLSVVSGLLISHLVLAQSLQSRIVSPLQITDLFYTFGNRDGNVGWFVIMRILKLLP